jgi:hypothetical protein
VFQEHVSTRAAQASDRLAGGFDLQHALPAEDGQGGRDVAAGDRVADDADRIGIIRLVQHHHRSSKIV